MLKSKLPDSHSYPRSCLAPVAVSTKLPLPHGIGHWWLPPDAAGFEILMVGRVRAFGQPNKSGVESQDWRGIIWLWSNATRTHPATSPGSRGKERRPQEIPHAGLEARYQVTRTVRSAFTLHGSNLGVPRRSRGHVLRGRFIMHPAQSPDIHHCSQLVLNLHPQLEVLCVALAIGDPSRHAD